MTNDAAIQADPRFERWLGETIAREASDLHITAEAPPYFRVHGELEPSNDQPVSAHDVEMIAGSLMSPEQKRAFASEGGLDLAWTRDGRRFRVNVFRERRRVAMAVRLLDEDFRPFDELGLPAQVSEFAQLRDGLVLVCGPTGSGKTTTLATLIDSINRERAAHILTIEDPIEYVHENQRALVRHRELHADVPSFAEGVRAALREDPDVILIGEMRDQATARAAILAAETGHLVFSTLHSGEAAGAPDRILGMFGADEQDALRLQLSLVLRAVVVQRLLPARAGGRVPACEVLVSTPAVANLVRTGRPQMIESAIESGQRDGMQTLDQSLADLVLAGAVDRQEAERHCRSRDVFTRRLGGALPTTSGRGVAARREGGR